MLKLLAAAVWPMLIAIEKAGAAASLSFLIATDDNPPDSPRILEIVGRVLTSLGDVIKLLPTGKVKLDPKSIIIETFRLAEFEDLGQKVDEYIVKLLETPKFVNDVWIGILTMAAFAGLLILIISVVKYVVNLKRASSESISIQTGNHPRLVSVFQEIGRTLFILLFVAGFLVSAGTIAKLIIDTAAGFGRGLYGYSGAATAGIGSAMFEMVLRVVETTGFWEWLLSSAVLAGIVGLMFLIHLKRMIDYVIQSILLMFRLPVWATGDKILTLEILVGDFVFAAAKVFLTTFVIVISPLIVVEINSLKGVWVVVAFGITLWMVYKAKDWAAVITDAVMISGISQLDRVFGKSEVKRVIEFEEPDGQTPKDKGESGLKSSGSKTRKGSDKSRPGGVARAAAVIGQGLNARIKEDLDTTGFGVAADSITAYRRGSDPIKGEAEKNQRVLKSQDRELIRKRYHLDSEPERNAEIFGLVLQQKIPYSSLEELIRKAKQILYGGNGSEGLSPETRLRFRKYGIKMLNEADTIWE